MTSLLVGLHLMVLLFVTCATFKTVGQILEELQLTK